MADDVDDDEKTEEPSAQRIEESRRRGEVASSKELSSVLVLAGTSLALILSVAYIWESMELYIEWLFNQELAKLFGDPKAFQTFVEKSALVAFKCAMPVLLASACVGIFVSVAQVGPLFASEALKFDPERINPINGFKRLFSMKSVVEALKGVMKFVFLLSIVYFFMKDRLLAFNGFLHADFVEGFAYGEQVIIELIFFMLIGLLIIGVADFAYQKYSYKKKMMMTKDQAKREHKEQEGSPEVRQKIRAIQREMSQKRMMADVPTADVIVTNPTHISIALKYDPQTMVSPEIVAKGADNVAMRIREIAKENGIPLVENVPLARSLYKTVKVGHPVPREMYKAVAEVLAFVFRLKRKNKALSQEVRY